MLFTHLTHMRLFRLIFMQFQQTGCIKAYTLCGKLIGDTFTFFTHTLLHFSNIFQQVECLNACTWVVNLIGNSLTNNHTLLSKVSTQFSQTQWLNFYTVWRTLCYMANHCQFLSCLICKCLYLTCVILLGDTFTHILAQYQTRFS